MRVTGMASVRCVGQSAFPPGVHEAASADAGEDDWDISALITVFRSKDGLVYIRNDYAATSMPCRPRISRPIAAARNNNQRASVRGLAILFFGFQQEIRAISPVIRADLCPSGGWQIICHKSANLRAGKNQQAEWQSTGPARPPKLRDFGRTQPPTGVGRWAENVQKNLTRPKIFPQRDQNFPGVKPPRRDGEIMFRRCPPRPKPGGNIRKSVGILTVRSSPR